jgi:hypothetical protein
VVVVVWNVCVIHAERGIGFSRSASYELAMCKCRDVAMQAMRDKVARLRVPLVWKVYSKRWF